VHFSTPDEILANAQSEFYALELDAPDSQPDPGAELELVSHRVETAIEDGTLAALASTYSRENDAVYDGLSRRGVPCVTFAPILKQRIFPLPEILELLLDLSQQSLNVPAEIEFAVNLSAPRGAPKEFAFLQMRPVLVARDFEAIDVERYASRDLVCSSDSVLGHGFVDGIRDLVVVDRERFDRSKSAQIALEVARFNEDLMASGRPYVLLGVGRWGASDPWLGVPVTWEQIAGARAIVECTFRDMPVVPSQGSHFFQNLTSSRTGYFTVEDEGRGFVDWDWLARQPAVAETAFVRLLRFERPLTVAMDGRRGRGIVAKPS
jgi:hypothetical protein